MTKFINLLLLICSSTVYAASMSQAHSIYEENKERLKNGVTRINDILFVQSSVSLKDDTAKERRRGEMRGMLDAWKALNNFYRGPIEMRLDFKTGVSPLLDKRIKDWLAKNNTAADNFALTSDCKVLCNRVIGNNRYQYCIALPYKASLMRSRPIQVSLDQWLRAVKSVKDDVSDEELPDFYLGLGCIESAIAWQADILRGSNALPFLSYHVRNIVAETPIVERELIQEYPSIKPGTKGFLNDLTISLYSIRDDNILPDLGKASLQIREYYKFINLIHDKLSKDKRNLSDTFAAKGSEVFPFVLRTSGHCAFGTNVSSGKNSEYEQALELFQQGRDLDKIIQLLYRSVNDSPGFANAYQLLGAALVAQGKYLSAAVYLTQAIQMNPCRAETKTNLAIAYFKLGFRHLAKGAALDSLITANATEWSRAKALEIIKIRYK